MESQHLYMVADKTISLRKSGSLREIEATVKKTFGIDNPEKKQTLLSDQLFNLITKAEADSKTFFKSNSAGKDIVHEFLGHNTGSKVESKRIHPMDEAFNMISQALEVAKNEETVSKERKGRIAVDPINEYVQQMNIKPYNDMKANHSIKDVNNLVDNIFSCRVSSGKKTKSVDPAQELVNNAFGSGRFPVDPIHTAAEWKELISSSLGSSPAAEKSRGVKTEFQSDFINQAFSGVNSTISLQEIFDLVSSKFGNVTLQSIKGILASKIGDGTPSETEAKLIKAYGPDVLTSLLNIVNSEKVTQDPYPYSLMDRALSKLSRKNRK